MATSIVQPAKPFFNRSTPAKLARSAVSMWLLLAVAAVVTFFTWYEPHVQIQSLRQQSTVVLVSANLTNDVLLLQEAVDSEASAGTSAAVERARAEYSIYRDNVAGSLELAGSLTAALPTDLVAAPFSLGGAKPDQEPRLLDLRQGFAALQANVTAARHLDNAGVKEEAAKQFQAARAGAAQLVNDAGNFNIATKNNFAQGHLIYSVWHRYTSNVLLAVAGILAAFIAWQYGFMVKRGKAGSPLATIFCLLLFVGVFSYAYLSTTSMDRKVESSLATFQSSLQIKAEPAVLLTPSSTSQQQALADGFDRAMVKADARIKYMPASLLALLFAALLYQVAVSHSIRDYRR